MLVLCRCSFFQLLAPSLCGCCCSAVLRHELLPVIFSSELLLKDSEPPSSSFVAHPAPSHVHVSYIHMLARRAGQHRMARQWGVTQPGNACKARRGTCVDWWCRAVFLHPAPGAFVCAQRGWLVAWKCNAKRQRLECRRVASYAEVCGDVGMHIKGMLGVLGQRFAG